MEFKGTKGVIKVVHVEKGIAKGIYLSVENQTHFIAEIKQYGRTEEENLSNATLLSKAPEMLEMLEKVLSEYTCDPSTHNEIEQLIKEATKLK